MPLTRTSLLPSGFRTKVKEGGNLAGERIPLEVCVHSKFASILDLGKRNSSTRSFGVTCCPQTAAAGPQGPQEPGALTRGPPHPILHLPAEDVQAGGATLRAGPGGEFLPAGVDPLGLDTCQQVPQLSASPGFRHRPVTSDRGNCP